MCTSRAVRDLWYNQRVLLEVAAELKITMGTAKEKMQFRDSHARCVPMGTAKNLAFL